MFDRVYARLKKSMVGKVVNKIAINHPAALAIRAVAHTVKKLEHDE